MVKNFLNLKIKFILISWGVIIVAFILWSRLIRERLPKEIPFELSVLGVIFIIFICTSYLVTIYLYLFAKEGKGIKNKHLIEFGKLINKPLIFLDNSIRNNPIIKIFTNYRIISFVTSFQYIFYKVPDKQERFNRKYQNHFLQYLYLFFRFPYMIFYMLLDIYPRIILLVALMVDVFIYKEIHYLYILFPIGILIFFSKYLYYSVDKTLEKYVSQLYAIDDYVYANVPFEEGRDEEISLLATGKFRTTGYFVWLQTHALREENIKYKVQISKMSALLARTPEQYDEDELLDQKFNKLMYDIIIPLALFEFEYDCVKGYTIIQRIKGFIFLGFLVCWVYILIVSFPYVDLPIMGTFINNFFIESNLFI